MRCFIYKKKYSHKKGFTLLETFVAIAILMLSITGPLTLSQKSLIAAQYSRDRIVSYYLAQDAVEYVRFVRDSEALGGGTTLASKLAFCFESTGCEVDTLNGAVSSAASLSKLKFDGELYQYVDGPETSFTRAVYMTDVSPSYPGLQNSQWKVTVRVAWKTAGSKNQSFVVDEFLMNLTDK
jgi:Tfp pilus assembly protein PilV